MPYLPPTSELKSSKELSLVAEAFCSPCSKNPTAELNAFLTDKCLFPLSSCFMSCQTAPTLTGEGEDICLQYMSPLMHILSSRNGMDLQESLSL